MGKKATKHPVFLTVVAESVPDRRDTEFHIFKGAEILKEQKFKRFFISIQDFIAKCHYNRSRHFAGKSPVMIDWSFTLIVRDRIESCLQPQKRKAYFNPALDT